MRAQGRGSLVSPEPAFWGSFFSIFVRSGSRKDPVSLREGKVGCLHFAQLVGVNFSCLGRILVLLAQSHKIHNVVLVHLFLRALCCTDVIQSDTETDVSHTKRGTHSNLEKTNSFCRIQRRNLVQVDLTKEQVGRFGVLRCVFGQGALEIRECLLKKQNGYRNRPTCPTY